jgi:CelD/BcsL family acetyltransferase involved in cellulose biosynthesis
LSEAVRQLESEGRLRLAIFETAASACVAPITDWDQFENSLSKSRRQNVRRTRRRLADHGEITVETSDGTTGLEADLAEFLRLEGSGWKVHKGTAVRANANTQRFYEEVAAWAASMGLLRLTFMRVGGHAVAVEYMLDDGAHRYGLKLGYDHEYARYGPGLKLQLEEIRHALEDARTYEMGLGENPIKLELMNAQRTIEHLALFPRSLRGALARRTARARHAVYDRARSNSLLRRARDLARALRARG